MAKTGDKQSNHQALTRKDLYDVLHDFWGEVAKPEFDTLGKRVERVEQQLEAIQGRTYDVEVQIIKLERKVVSKTDFDNLKDKVDLHHPTV